MPQSYGNFVENAFNAGLVTEYTGMNFPEKAAIAADNTRFLRKGNAQRRKGFSYEDAVVAQQTTTSGGSYFVRNGASTSYIWQGATSEGLIDFLVIQTGNWISFTQADSNGFYHGKIKPFQINLIDYRTATRIKVEDYVADFATGDGKLFINHPACKPLYVVYDNDTDDITVTAYDIGIRDFEGLDDGLDVDERPTTLSNKHKYNLFNQGWGIQLKFYKSGLSDFDLDTPLGTLGTTQPTWENARTDYPSNSDVWFYYKKANTSPAGTENFNAYLVDSANTKGTSLAPKGHYIYNNAFQIDRSAKAGFGNFTVQSSNGRRPSAVAFYAGRAWYGGVNAPGYSDQIYYTQIIERDDQIGRCYQLNDPTNEDQSDLLDTDGGVIAVQGLAATIAIIPHKNTLFIFGTNGVWSIAGSGPAGTGFKATDFVVNKICDIATTNKNSILALNEGFVWWNRDGIWTITTQDGANYSAQSISRDTISTWFTTNVPVLNRGYAAGAYNPLTNTVQWLYRSSAAPTVGDRFLYDRILELNLTTGAFQPFSWSGSDQYFRSIVCPTNLSVTGLNNETVTDSTGDTVYENNLTTVVTSEVFTETSAVSARFKYITSNVYAGSAQGLAFLEETDSNCVDFAARYPGGKSYSSYFITGAKVHGEGNKFFNMSYITVFTEQPLSSANLQARWDWTNHGNSGKWSPKQGIYPSRAYRDVNRRKLLIRGEGPAVQLYFSSVGNNWFDIIGWTSFEGSHGVP